MVVTGPNGAGKKTLMSRLHRVAPDHFEVPKLTVGREPIEGESEPHLQPPPCARASCRNTPNHLFLCGPQWSIRVARTALGENSSTALFVSPDRINADIDHDRLIFYARDSADAIYGMRSARTCLVSPMPSLAWLANSHAAALCGSCCVVRNLCSQLRCSGRRACEWQSPRYRPVLRCGRPCIGATTPTAPVPVI